MARTGRRSSKGLAISPAPSRYCLLLETRNSCVSDGSQVLMFAFMADDFYKTVRKGIASDLQNPYDQARIRQCMSSRYLSLSYSGWRSWRSSQRQSH